MIPNYVGVTGIKSVSDARAVLGLFEKHGFTMQSCKIPMIGILVSGRMLDVTWESERYPRIDVLGEIISEIDGKAFCTVHVDNKPRSKWCDEILAIEAYLSGMDVGGIQINVKHPLPGEIARLKKEFHKDVSIIMQYSDDFISKDPKKAAADFSAYAHLVDYVLIDPSRGQGLEINAGKALSHYTELKKHFDIGIGFAGGFTSANIGKYIEKFKKHVGGSNFSIDVETGVRDNKNDLSIKMVDEYLSSAHEAFQKN
jgi:hypothetical protein